VSVSETVKPQATAAQPAPPTLLPATVSDSDCNDCGRRESLAKCPRCHNSICRQCWFSIHDGVIASAAEAEAEERVEPSNPQKSCRLLHCPLPPLPAPVSDNANPHATAP
jgi:hypothetical protein